MGGAWGAARSLPPQAEPFAAALLWIAIPIALHLAARRSLEEAGIAWKSPRRTLAFAALYAAVFLPLWTVGTYMRMRSGTSLRLHWPGADLLAVSFVFELAWHGLPEEVFFRGFVQPRLAARFPARSRRVLGVPLTPAIVLAAALFAATHFAFVPRAERLLTFFPGLLFGALREETGDVVAPSIFHALCNATLYAVERGTFA